MADEMEGVSDVIEGRWKPSDQELRLNALSSAVAVFSNCTTLAHNEVLSAAKEFYGWLKDGS